MRAEAGLAAEEVKRLQKGDGAKEKLVRLQARFKEAEDEISKLKDEVKKEKDDAEKEEKRRQVSAAREGKKVADAIKRLKVELKKGLDEAAVAVAA